MPPTTMQRASGKLIASNKQTRSLLTCKPPPRARLQSRVSTARLLAARFDAYKRKNVMHDNAGLVEVETDKDEEE